MNVYYLFFYLILTLQCVKRERARKYCSIEDIYDLDILRVLNMFDLCVLKTMTTETNKH